MKILEGFCVLACVKEEEDESAFKKTAISDICECAHVYERYLHLFCLKYFHLFMYSNYVNANAPCYEIM